MASLHQREGRSTCSQTRKRAGGGRSLILSAHIDCVPAGDPKRWKFGPWSGHIEDGQVYARGAHDDRTGGALIWMVMDLLNQLGIQTRGDIYIDCSVIPFVCSPDKRSSPDPNPFPRTVGPFSLSARNYRVPSSIPLDHYSHHLCGTSKREPRIVTCSGGRTVSNAL